MSGFSRVASILVPFFQRHPLLKSSASAGGLMAFGDVISQTIIEKTKKYDITRTARFGLIGSAFVDETTTILVLRHFERFEQGPALHKWYGLLERYLKFSSPAASALSKMATDQLTFAPTFLYIFFWLNGGLQGHKKEEIQKHISRDYFDVIIANYKLWPAVQIVNFYFIPLSQRVIFVQSVALLWNTYLAWKVNQEGTQFPVVVSNQIGDE